MSSGDGDTGLGRDATKGSSLTLFNEQLAMRAEPLSWPEASASSQLGASTERKG